VSRDTDVALVTGSNFMLDQSVCEDVIWVGPLEGELAAGRKALPWPSRDAAKLAIAFFLARHDRPGMARGPGIHRARPTART